MAGLPQYVGTESLTGNTTVSASKATLYAFLVPANISNLQNICRAAFDIPTNGEVKCAPLDPMVMLLFDQVSWLGNPTARRLWTVVSPALAAGHGPRAHFRALPGQGLIENEVLVQIPVQITNESTGISYPALFTPWIWVDNPLSMLVGREVYGYPKGPGIVSGMKDLPQYDAFTAIPIPMPLAVNASPPSLALSVFGGNINDLYWSYRPLLSVAPQPPLGLAPSPLQLLTYQEWLDVLNWLYPSSAPLLNNWSSVGVTQVFLKEFPDITDAQLACFQQITSAQYQIQKIYSTQAFNWPMTLTISHLDSDDLCTALGIEATVPVWGGVQVVLDFMLTGGSVVWSAQP